MQSASSGSGTISRINGEPGYDGIIRYEVGGTAGDFVSHFTEKETIRFAGNRKQVINYIMRFTNTSSALNDHSCSFGFLTDETQVVQNDGAYFQFSFDIY